MNTLLRRYVESIGDGRIFPNLHLKFVFKYLLVTVSVQTNTFADITNSYM